jgi:hypothetical protein
MKWEARSCFACHELGCPFVRVPLAPLERAMLIVNHAIDGGEDVEDVAVESGKGDVQL